MGLETAKVGKRGTVGIPSAIRRNYGIEEGSLIIVEARPEGVLLRPVVTLPVEIYTPERKAGFLLNNTVTSEDYAWAVKEVRKMGLDPDTIPHDKTTGKCLLTGSLLMQTFCSPWIMEVLPQGVCGDSPPMKNVYSLHPNMSLKRQGVTLLVQNS